MLEFIGGAEGIRTPDLCSAIAALSQLSYSPGRVNGFAGPHGGGRRVAGLWRAGRRLSMDAAGRTGEPGSDPKPPLPSLRLFGRPADAK